MSLIIDALEKVQRQSQGTALPEVWPHPVESSSAFAAPLSPINITRTEENTPVNTQTLTRRGVIVFAVILALLAFAGLRFLAVRLALPDNIAAVKTSAAAVLKTGDALPILRGVLQDAGESYCILDSEILKMNDTLRGYTVVSIEPRQVSVRDAQDRITVLQLQESR